MGHGGLARLRGAWLSHSASVPPSVKTDVTEISVAAASGGHESTTPEKPVNSRPVAERGWIFVGQITSQSRWAGGYPQNISSVQWPIHKGDYLILNNDVRVHGLSGLQQHSRAPVVGALHSGERVAVEEVDLSRARGGGNFVWVKVGEPAENVAPARNY